MHANEEKVCKDQELKQSEPTQPFESIVRYANYFITYSIININVKLEIREKSQKI